MSRPGRQPGPLREAHAHIAEFGREMSQLNLGACADRAHCLDLVRCRAAEMDAAGEPGWLLATSLRGQDWPDPRWPTAAELDAACPNRACILRGFDHHSCAVNTRALSAAGLDSGKLPGDLAPVDASGRPTGTLLEDASVRALSAAPAPTRAQWKVWVARACAGLAALGYVEVHDMLAQEWLGPVLGELEREGTLALRVRLYAAMEELDAIARGRGAWESDRVRLAGGKMFADGTLSSRTAWVLEPYADPLAECPRGKALLRAGQIVAAMERTSALGLGLAVHAIGDGAVREVLDARAAWLARGGSGGGPRKEIGGEPQDNFRGNFRGLRIEHCELVHPRDVARFAELGVVASVQPCHLLYDAPGLARQFPGLRERVLPLTALARAGLVPGRTLVFGSDVPIVPANPEDSIRAAMGQGLSEPDAWKCFGAE